LSSTLRGVLWMSGAVLSFCAMAIAARELLAHLGVFEVLFFRTGVALLIVLAVALPRRAPLGTRLFRVHLWRNLFHLGGQGSWVFALGALPLATVFAIEFTSPIFTALLAVLFLGERMNAGRVVMLALGFAGVLVILRPACRPCSRRRSSCCSARSASRCSSSAPSASRAATRRSPCSSGCRSSRPRSASPRRCRAGACPSRPTCRGSR
jgi:threonine/homoserine efflux transporter RhtA